MAAIKAIVEDLRRHEEDRKTNNTTAHVVLEDGENSKIDIKHNAQYSYPDWTMGKSAYADIQSSRAVGVCSYSA